MSGRMSPSWTTPLSDKVSWAFINRVKGKILGSEAATLVSRYGNSSYDDHPLQWLIFSVDGKRLHSCCPGPDGSDASVAGPFHLKAINEDGDYVLELAYGYQTTFIVYARATNGEVAAVANDRPRPNLVTCQRYGCPQRHRTRVLNGFSDYDELSGERNIGDPGVVELKRCAACKHVHYCSVECQKSDWKGHRVE